MMWPNLIGKEFKLPVVWPVIEAVIRDGAFAVNLLQEHYVRIDMTQRILDIMQDETKVAGTETLVDVISQYLDVRIGHLTNYRFD